MVSISSIKTFFTKTAKAVETTGAVGKSAVKNTRVRPSIPGVTVLDRNVGDKLVVSESRVLEDGTKKITTLVYGDNGAYIGHGMDEGLVAYRDKLIKSAKGDSIFGGTKINIDKNYHETMSMAQHNKSVVKEYTPEGVLEHAESTVAYRHWDEPKVQVYDRSKTLSGETLYGEAVKSKKTMQEAAEAEKKVAAEAAKFAEIEKAEKLAASLPRVNVGKVFNKNIEEFKCVEEVKPDGSIIRRYFDPYASNSASHPLITTIDRGSYHEEIIYDSSKKLKLTCKQVAGGKPEYFMKKGPNYTQTKKYNPKKASYEDYQFYNDGASSVVFLNGTYYPEKYSVQIKNPYPKETRALFQQPEYLTLSCGYESRRTGYPLEEALHSRMQEIIADAKKNYVDLKSLWEPYKA